MARAGLLAVSLMIFGWALPGAAQPRLVKDLDPGSVDPQRDPPRLSDFTSVGSRAVFLVGRSGDADSGAELWGTDGTDGGTERLRAFFGFQTSWAGGNGRVAFFFVATPSYPEPVSPTLWRTDGTVEGTFPLGRFAAVGGMAIHQGSLVFSGCATATDCEPWASDGTVAGTRRLRDVTPGKYGSDPRAFLSVGDRLYFLATASDGPGLWQTDLMRRGTRRVALLPSYSIPRDLQAAGGRLFFVMNGENSLWTSDGTAEGTRAVPPFDRPSGRGPAVSQLLGAVGGLEYFAGVDPVLGPQLYRTDGTPGGTRRLSSFPRAQEQVTEAVPLADRLLFVGPDFKLWVSGGSRPSTHPLSGCAGGCPEPFFDTDGFSRTVSGERAFFSGSLRGDVQPWVTDGTPEGTRRLLELCGDDGCGSYPQFNPAIHGRVLFEAAWDLWSTDGTAAGTRKVGEGVQVTDQEGLPVAAAGARLVYAGFDRSAPNGDLVSQLKSAAEEAPEDVRVLGLPLNDGLSSNPQSFTALWDDVLFFACSPNAGGVWKTRGTAETTVRLTDSQGFCIPQVRETFQVVGGAAYFAATRAGDYWSELWRTDGTPEGTRQLTHVGPQAFVQTLTPFQGKVYFVVENLGNEDGTGRNAALWASDGTEAGTGPLFDLGAAFVHDLLAFEGSLYFYGEATGSPVSFLYRSDGTAAGTRPLLLSQGYMPPRFLRLGGQLLFVESGILWKSDGTPEGTLPLTAAGARTQRMAEIGGRAVFMGLTFADENDYAGTPTLYRTDGTVAGTVPVRTFVLDGTVNPGLYFAQPQFTALGGSLFFIAADAGHGTELWKTDGTTAGTVLVSDVNPGPGSSRITGLTAADGRLYFAADDGEHGIEPWTSDGTAAETRRRGDLAEGPSSSSPRDLAVAAGGLYFSADDGVNGREPWVLPLDAAAFAGKGKP